MPQKMKRPVFIAFEGIDGSGKTTQVQLLADRLREQGHNLYTTAEPTKSRIGELIRDIFKHKMEADHRTIAALYAADRLEHLLNKTDGMLKMLADGQIVITDRYYFSSYAYHSVHMNMDWVIQANSISAGLLKPDLNVFIDIEPESGIQRLNKGRTAIELYESLDNLKQVKEKYFEAFEKFKGHENIFIVNGERTGEEISRDIWTKISSMLS